MRTCQPWKLKVVTQVSLFMQKQEAQFKAAELEFHQQQLQHVSEEQRQAEELIQNSLDSGGLPSC